MASCLRSMFTRSNSPGTLTLRAVKITAAPWGPQRPAADVPGSPTTDVSKAESQEYRAGGREGGPVVNAMCSCLRQPSDPPTAFKEISIWWKLLLIRRSDRAENCAVIKEQRAYNWLLIISSFYSVDIVFVVGGVILIVIFIQLLYIHLLKS